MVNPSKIALEAATAYSGRTFSDEKEAINDLAESMEAFAGRVISQNTPSHTLWRIWSIEHNAWWGPAHNGYVKNRDLAEAKRANTERLVDALERVVEFMRNAVSEIHRDNVEYYTDFARAAIDSARKDTP
jgi:hypothetical protein